MKPLHHTFCLFVLLASTACSNITGETPPPDLVYTVTQGPFVNRYEIGERIVFREGINVVSDPERNLFFGMSGKCYSRWIPSFWLPDDPQYDEFDRIAQRNNDTGFTGEIRNRIPTCLPMNLTALSIACNLDWDEAHAAGVPLDELCTFSFTPYGPFIQNDYRGKEPDEIEKRLCDLTREELFMVGLPAYINLTIPDHLMGKSIRFTVTYTDTQGKELKSTCVLKTEK